MCREHLPAPENQPAIPLIVGAGIQKLLAIERMTPRFSSRRDKLLADLYAISIIARENKLLTGESLLTKISNSLPTIWTRGFHLG